MMWLDNTIGFTLEILSSLNWGSVPDWFAALGTIAAVIVALTIATRDGRRILRIERIAQASKISIWQKGTPPQTPESVISNASTEPIYDVLVSWGIAYGAGDPYSKGNENQIFLQKVPPGKYRAETPPSQTGGMHIKLALSICFRDSRGRFWHRNATGVLYEIKEHPFKFMGVTEPIEKWGGLGPYIHGQ